jgi:hypothetical protein
MEAFIAMLEGSGDCDILESFYKGDWNSNIYSGWRDLMADRGAFFIMEISLGIITNA